jgi:hypothetical protein
VLDCFQVGNNNATEADHVIFGTVRYVCTHTLKVASHYAAAAYAMIPAMLFIECEGVFPVWYSTVHG